MARKARSADLVRLELVRSVTGRERHVAGPGEAGYPIQFLPQSLVPLQGRYCPVPFNEERARVKNERYAE